MTLLLGTNDGVYRVSDIHFNDASQVLDAGRVMRVQQFEWADGTYACSKTGLYRSTDGGETWSDQGVPQNEVYSVLVSPDNERLYTGTHPAHLYVSEDDGDSWRELEGFQELPSRDEWYTPRHRNEAHIRSLGAHPDTPNRVIAGVEVGGVHVSEDRGETWAERRDGVQDDVHHVLIRDDEEYIASCGDGLYRTTDAGRSWTRLDEELSHRYFREATIRNGRLYAAAARSSPGTWEGESGADGAMFVSENDGETFASVSYPGAPQEVILAWASSDIHLVAGTNEGRVIVERDDDWETVGTVPAGIRSLCLL
ncbi:WD40/YVTN/BNR-like repeat-containing protein [Halopelagius fulvigenes]|uniref:WD40/YVTN/BNR-like repeat-containing protein n=1 Tax=Halopelagius fulvigenes TaxID=1198324 RepID=A0ABD5TW01_9EURY